jgi:transposase
MVTGRRRKVKGETRFAGIDWATKAHAVCVVEADGAIRARFDVPSTGKSFDGLVKRLVKPRSMGFRWACDKKLRNALIDFADDSRHASPWAARIYANAIARGKRHPYAVRILARAWVRVIWRMWQDRNAYDFTKHGGAAMLQAA